MQSARVVFFFEDGGIRSLWFLDAKEQMCEGTRMFVFWAASCTKRDLSFCRHAVSREKWGFEDAHKTPPRFHKATLKTEL